MSHEKQTSHDVREGDGGSSSGHALEFIQPGNTHVDLGNTLFIPIEFTIEVWLKPNGKILVDQIAVTKDEDSIPSNQWRIGLKNGRPYAMMADASLNDGGLWTGCEYSLMGTAALAPNTWAHVAVTKKGTAWKLYVDGVGVAAFSATTDLQHAGGAPLRIGGRGTAEKKNFDGVIDEVRVWNVAQAGEIAAEYRSILTNAHPDWHRVVGYWRFEEGTGLTTADDTATTHGTLANGPNWVDGAPVGPRR